MNKKHAKRRRDIKTKLMAAICMLLVSSIMMVSTTYAWFTLSTAPEVTGINTAVGANGNLEMALLPTDAFAAGKADFGITTGTGDSVKAVNERNVTWGNLVDVSDNTYYGMDQITLFPSQLNTDAVLDANGNPTKLPSTGLLETPVYGADGRIAQMSKGAQTGILQTIENNTAFFPDEDMYGVRAVGTASGMSARELAYKNARAAANDARSLAANKAAASLSARGNKLAGIAVTLAAGGEGTYTKADLEAVGLIINDLITTDGVLEQIETAYMQYLLALAASSYIAEDAAWTTVKAEIEKEGATLDSVVTAVETLLNGSLPTELATGINAYKATRNTILGENGAKAKYDALYAKNKDSYTWTELSSVLNLLANPNVMKVNDKTIDEIKANKQPLIDDVMAGKGITVSIVSGGGVYADVADHCGNYTASVKIEGVEFQGITIKTTATMKTDTTIAKNTGGYLVALGNHVNGLGVPSTTGEAMPITDTFGYIIDLAFRTNAADSNLLLQTDAVDRIYKTSTGAEIDTGKTNAAGEKIYESTMGHGATMTFQSTNATFSNDQVKDLMKAIRIIFFDPTNLNVLATAKLDVAAATVGVDGVTAKMYIYTLTQGGGYVAATYDATATGVEYYTLATTYTALTDADAKVYEGQLYTSSGTDTYAEATYAEGNGDSYYFKRVDTYSKYTGTTAPADGTQLYIKQAAGEVRSADNKIMSLTQNTAHALSVLVYLDGNSVTNADVAATGNSSMKGTMNLQFSSSANLTPMEYTPLMNQGGNGEDGE